MLPLFYEHNDDQRIPLGYGIDKSYDGKFYVYYLNGSLPCYLKDKNGLDSRYGSYQEAINALVQEDVKQA